VKLPGLILVALIGLWAITASAQGLSQDSARFAGFWNLEESGDSVAASNYLIGSVGEQSERFEQLANFLLAWRAFKVGDDASVPVFLSFGVPPELADHASWLRASALDRAGQTELAKTHWLDLASDSNSIYRPDAVYELAEQCRLTRNLDSLSMLAAEFNRISSDAAAVQRLNLMAAEILTELNRHREAVDNLWGVYLSNPVSDEGKQAKDRLQRYEADHSFQPRTQTVPEFELELDKLDRAAKFSYGLERVREKISDPSWKSQDDMLLFYEGRFLNGIRHNRDALEVLQRHAKSYPNSPYRASELFYLARSAYLRDQDDLAISTVEQLNREFGRSIHSANGLKLLGTLHLDRGRPRESAAAFERWHQRVIGSKDETEALWLTGRSYWEARAFGRAMSEFLTLARFERRSDYYPVALYWASRAAFAMGQASRADSLQQILLETYPYSYYTIALKQPALPDSLWIRNDLKTVGLDSLFENGGDHAKKFALLCAMRLPELALKEWEKARDEFGGSAGINWWKAQLHLWAGDRLAAWRVVNGNLKSYITTEGERPFDFFRVVYPLDFDPQIIGLADRYHLDPYFVFALICQESHYEETIVSGAGAIGLMQLMPETARIQAKKMGKAFNTADLYQADDNLEIGIAHVADLFNRFSGDSVLVLCAYNAGSSAAQAWFEEFGNMERDEFIENIPYRETRLFVKSILEHAAAYRRLYPDAVCTRQPGSSK
jgi:soluble lytic murein transglycosylase